MTVVTLVLLMVVIFAARSEIVKAWQIIVQIDWWILILLIPVQIASYYATGGMIFSYLRSKGNIRDMSHWMMTRLSLELNFVNHILPSGGAAGFSYLAWVLSRHKVSVARSTMAQLIRFVLTFLSFVLLLLVAVVILTVMGEIVKVTVFAAVGLAVAAIGGTGVLIWMIKSKRRLIRFSTWLTQFVNRIVKFFTRGKKPEVLGEKLLPDFFIGLHDDYLVIRKERKILFVPFVWAAIANMLDVALIWIAFWALGYPLDAALLFVAFGIASIAGALSATPGGTGVYETVMVAFLAASGITPEVAIAGTLLARVTLLAGTILFGYAFYQLTVLKYGKRTT